MAELLVEGLSVHAGGNCLVDRASFRLRPGDFVALLGPNGAGKSSLIRASLGLSARSAGSARLNDVETQSLTSTERARRLSYLPQMRSLAWPNRVRDIVALGRFSHGAGMGRLSKQDALAVDRALAACDLLPVADRRADTLSGGELARVHCARAFAAQAPLLVADEPTASLDPRHQFRILDLIQDYVSAGGGALTVLHDVGLAARYANRLIWMRDGRIVAQGSPDETYHAQMLGQIYGVRAEQVNGRLDMIGAL